MSRLIVISNRVQPPTTGPGGNQGGLAVALLAALREQGGIWFGWSGETTDQFSGHINFQQGGGVTTATIDLEEQDIDEYYNGYANRTLWPLFHYRIDLTEFERDFDSGYRRVNERFAGFRTTDRSSVVATFHEPWPGKSRTSSDDFQWLLDQ